MVAKAAIAIVAILINGRPVSLPTPAFIHNGQVFAPVRDAFQQLGATVRWDEASKRVVISVGDRRLELDAAAGAVVANGHPMPLRAAPMLRGHTLFAPLGPLAEALGAKVEWQPSTKTLRLDLPVSAPPEEATIADILRAAQQYEGRPVLIAGEYRGWLADPFGFATSHGPPVTRSDWVLRDAGGHIYCSADVHPQSDIPLAPLSSVGRRVRVTGLCRIAASGIPYVEPTSVSAVAGLEGLTCSVSTDKHVYKLGEPVRITLTFGNPLPEAITFERLSAQQYDFFVRTPDGKDVWQWSRGRAFAAVISSVRLEPGALTHFEETWDQRPNIPAEVLRVPARYRIVGRINPRIEAYPTTIEIVGNQ